MVKRKGLAKVFLVVETDERYVHHVASTYQKAWFYVKTSQLKQLILYKKRGWTEKQYEWAKKYYEDKDELHPYDIEEKIIDGPD